MRILINCSNLRFGGALQVAHSFINEICQGSDHDFLVVLSDELYMQLGHSLFPKNVELVNYSIRPSILKALLGWDKYLTRLEANFKSDAVFSIFGPAYWRPKSRHICGFARPIYIYRESPFFSQLTRFERIKTNILQFIHLFDFKYNCTILITENTDVTSRLKNRINKSVFTVTNTYNQVFEDIMLWDNSLRLDLDGAEFKFLTISANYPHKNLQIIKKVIPILKNLHPEFKFKFFLSISSDDFGINDEDILNDNIQFLGPVSINQCPSLYSQCDFLFLPTLLECFSASYCEAMYMKVPILTSDLSFARGICEKAAVYFNPLDPVEIANLMYQVAMNREMQNRLIFEGESQIKKFDNYRIRARKYLEIITES